MQSTQSKKSKHQKTRTGQAILHIPRSVYTPPPQQPDPAALHLIVIQPALICPVLSPLVCAPPCPPTTCIGSTNTRRLTTRLPLKPLA
ncbi:hypothetical protein CONLIGDRAFT_686681 [Coniochaeta ligniaria NRRL 30616]|uniref:Uncharacterized protein n=1 Tax=Coniochaeta ligniaria NRRL 30616 TaxID=1408157 RepID=A0A1J7J6W4_9PEZI|nr:hypothetical protein CONLIGDRAFT_686681 [Coniochaeta ligniaria NRRL 30616]